MKLKIIFGLVVSAPPLGLCGKKLTPKYAKEAQSNTEFLLSKIKFCSVHYDFTFDTASFLFYNLLNLFNQ
jgi:hypothetical protein